MTADDLERLADQWTNDAVGQGKYAIPALDSAAYMAAAVLAGQRAAQLRGTVICCCSRPAPVPDAFIDVAENATAAEIDAIFDEEETSDDFDI
ncbi:MAG: hypothetical protein M3256_13730 [Actinomycetota bacterium]|nr:hypothetical protein [Actinomycetota bacterium]MDQ6947294.1 hypothetical protein [Actinomycetota bacterium]